MPTKQKKNLKTKNTKEEEGTHCSRFSSTNISLGLMNGILWYFE